MGRHQNILAQVFYRTHRECGGTGFHMSSYNLLGRLDYWINLDVSDSEWLFPGEDSRRIPGGSARMMVDVLHGDG
jgi:hypothetical protein